MPHVPNRWIRMYDETIARLPTTEARLTFARVVYTYVTGAANSPDASPADLFGAACDGIPSARSRMSPRYSAELLAQIRRELETQFERD